MSKKSQRVPRPQPVQQPFWLWLVGGGAVLLIVAGLALTNNRPTTSSKQAVSPAASPVISPQQANSTPRLVVDRTTIDEGKLKVDTPVRSSFRLSNTGNQPLQILNEPQVELVQGC